MLELIVSNKSNFKIIALALVFFLLLFVVGLYVLAVSGVLRDGATVEITNANENSLTVVWQTDTPQTTKLKYIKVEDYKDNLVTNIANFISANTVVEMGLDDMPSARIGYTHHLSVGGLSPESEYIVWALDHDFPVSKPVFHRTKAVNEELYVPDPGYGEIRGIEENDGVLIVGDGENVMSTRIAANNTFSLDLNQINTVDNNGLPLPLDLKILNGTRIYNTTYVANNFKPFNIIEINQVSSVANPRLIQSVQAQEVWQCSNQNGLLVNADQNAQNVFTDVWEHPSNQWRYQACCSADPSETSGSNFDGATPGCANISQSKIGILKQERSESGTISQSPSGVTQDSGSLSDKINSIQSKRNNKDRIAIIGDSIVDGSTPLKSLIEGIVGGDKVDNLAIAGTGLTATRRSYPEELLNGNYSVVFIKYVTNDIADINYNAELGRLINALENQGTLTVLVTAPPVSEAFDASIAAKVRTLNSELVRAAVSLNLPVVITNLEVLDSATKNTASQRSLTRIGTSGSIFPEQILSDGVHPPETEVAYRPLAQAFADTYCSYMNRSCDLGDVNLQNPQIEAIGEGGSGGSVGTNEQNVFIPVPVTSGSANNINNSTQGSAQDNQIFTSGEVGRDNIEINSSGLYSFFRGQEQLANREIITVDGKAIIRFFEDLNGNGIRDENEQIIRDVTQFSFTKEADIFSYNLNSGWNLVHIPLVLTSNDADANLASTNLKRLQREGNEITRMAIFRNGEFQIYILREGENEFASDFRIFPGDGVFLFNSATNLTINIRGQEITTPPVMEFNVGWNLVGFSAVNSSVNSNKLFSATGLENMDIFSEFENGTYSSQVKSGVDIFGNPININKFSGYFVRISSGSATFDSSQI